MTPSIYEWGFFIVLCIGGGLPLYFRWIRKDTPFSTYDEAATWYTSTFITAVLWPFAACIALFVGMLVVVELIGKLLYFLAFKKAR